MDPHLSLEDIIEHPDLPDTEPVLRAGQVPQSLEVHLYEQDLETLRHLDQQ